MACAWTCEDRIVDRTGRQDQTRQDQVDRQTDRPAPSIVIHRGLLSIVTLSDGGVLIFFLILAQAGRQAGRQVACLVLPCLVVTVCVMNHHMGRGAKPPKRTSFFLGGEGGGRTGRSSNRTGQGGESFHQFIYIHIHTRTRERDGEGGIRNSDRWSLLFFVDEDMRIEERLVGR